MTTELTDTAELNAFASDLREKAIRKDMSRRELVDFLEKSGKSDTFDHLRSWMSQVVVRYCSENPVAGMVIPKNPFEAIRLQKQVDEGNIEAVRKEKITLIHETYRWVERRASLEYLVDAVTNVPQCDLSKKPELPEEWSKREICGYLSGKYTAAEITDLIEALGIEPLADSLSGNSFDMLCLNAVNSVTRQGLQGEFMELLRSQ